MAFNYAAEKERMLKTQLDKFGEDHTYSRGLSTWQLRMALGAPSELEDQFPGTYLIAVVKQTDLPVASPATTDKVNVGGAWYRVVKHVARPSGIVKLYLGI
jgi:hypothetical protein